MHCNYSDGLHTSGNQSIPITMVNLFNLELECFSELFRIQFQSFCLHHAVYPIPPIFCMAMVIKDALYQCWVLWAGCYTSFIDTALIKFSTLNFNSSNVYFPL